MEVHQQHNDYSYQVNLLALQIVVGTHVQISTCNGDVYVPIVYRVDMQAVFLDRIVEIGKVEGVDIWFVEVVIVVAYDHIDAPKVQQIVGMDSHRDYEQVTSMLYLGVHPNCNAVDHMVDHPFRIEEDHSINSIGETMALLAGKIEDVLKMQKPAIYVLVQVNVAIH